MRIAVLGAGIIGTTTAYYLARRGHEVVLVERRADVGLETSFANGGLVSPSMAAPWAAPGVPMKLLKCLGREDSPLLLRPKAIPAMTGWGIRFLRNCSGKRWRKNTQNMLRLAAYSRDALDELTTETGIAYERSSAGTLIIFRDPRSLEHAREKARLLDEFGLAFRLLDAEACTHIEPALRPVMDKLAGGVHYSGDRSGNALMFTREMARLCRAAGVEIRLDTTVESLERRGDRVEALITDHGRLRADNYVLALGNQSVRIARRLGFKLPIYPVKGYSMTVATTGWNNAPTVPVIDEDPMVGIVRLGDRIRVAGTVEFAGFDDTKNRRRLDLLLRALTDLFPDFRGRETGEHWAGLRPMTADGPPLIGPTPYKNLFLNTGHGHLGWTLACGSARAVTDLIAGGQPEISLEGLTLARFQALPG